MTNQTQLSTFNFEQSSIRVIAVNNEPWFVAKDVCDTLGIKNPTQALENLDEDERAMFNIGLDQRVNFDNRVSEINIVSESGMYTLILRCRDAVKKGSVPHRFRKWVTAEVLPQIRKTGSYTKSTTDERTGLRQAVSALVSKKGLLYSDAYTLIHQRFNIEHIDELTPEQVGMAVEYVHKIYLEGELIIDEPKKEDEQLLRLLVSAYHFCYEAHELREKIVKTYIGWDIDRHFSPHYLHNLGIPLEQFLEKTRDFIHSNSERIMFVKGMNHLLEEPKQTARF
ncbi:Bro-N domain-containing protein [Glaesserella parasuis]|uniref:Putative antirepressor protein n=2 Tax=Glaesserella parasuis TaxID=738 RepID=B8F4I9_GLAP5|nr:Bro-N domain-containing protein [Glaesserella parasuis]ACL32241.1 putative antirepressor protein [Glaesserella parasuis SH0165]MDG6325783.1 Bro-N domain-containing protein [Glaesserella parasuis]MDG6455135.1 Bro-N domain-containing protein [Glaesserella parasuis]MDG6869223.1 Bro-N domain-containing protein [Glaesserella parasuis]MDO9925076.1 Bro-N domain-containing protein [Glaesserella parasuis]